MAHASSIRLYNRISCFFFSVIPLHTLLKVPKNLPKYLQLASVDYPIARELGRQFDSIGITYPLSTEINTILTKDAIPTYHEMKSCQTDKYSFELSLKLYGKTYGFMVRKFRANDLVV